MSLRQSLPFFLCALGLLLGLPAAHAEGLVYVDEPAGCFDRAAYPCAVRALEPLKLQRGDDVFQFAADTSVVWLSPDDLRVIEGRIWIEKSNKLSLRLLGGDSVVMNGEFLITHQEDQSLLVMNLNGSVQFPAKGFLKSEALPVGFQNWYGRRMTEGNVERGVVRPIEVATFVDSWARTGVSTKAARLDKVKLYKKLWRGNVDQSAVLYKDIVERRIASQEDAASARARREQKAQAEREKLRQMFREKNGLE
jgi:hypothetical protein